MIVHVMFLIIDFLLFQNLTLSISNPLIAILAVLVNSTYPLSLASANFCTHLPYFSPITPAYMMEPDHSSNSHLMFSLLSDPFLETESQKTSLMCSFYGWNRYYISKKTLIFRLNPESPWNVFNLSHSFLDVLPLLM